METRPTDLARETAVGVTIIIPVRNESRDIGRLLDEIDRQASPPGGREVIVVDGGSTDGTKELVSVRASSRPYLEVVDNPRLFSSSGRNLGLRMARGTYVLFLDGHCSIPRNDYLVRMVEIFESTGATCLCRPQTLNRFAEEGWSRVIATARHSWLGHNLASDIYSDEAGFTNPRSAGAAYVRSQIAGLRGFDESFDACEDVEFNHRVARAGFPAYRHPDLRIDYRPRSSLKALFSQMVRYGRGRARLAALHPSETSWPLAVLTLVLIGVVGLFAFGETVIAGCILGALAGGGALVVLGESLRLGGPTVNGGRVALTFAVIFAGLVLGFWRGLPGIVRYRGGSAAGAR
jgi:glycosyltransferase involved in cell wall biosynthesis